MRITRSGRLVTWHQPTQIVTTIQPLDMSEIDKIFASKPSASSKSENLSSKKRSFSDSETVVDTSADLTGPPKRRKKNNKKKEKDPSTTSKRVEESPSERRPLPETVVDTSADLAGPSKLRKMDKKNTRVSKKKKGIDFEDSRGSGDRKPNCFNILAPSYLYVADRS